MKRNILFAVLVFGIMLASCGSKGKTDTVKAEENSIVGKWEFQSFTADIKTSDQKITDKIKTSLTSHESEVKGRTVEFTSDGKMVSEGDSTSYSISGNKLTIKINDEINRSSEFKVNGDALSITNDYIKDDFFDEDTRKSYGIDDDVKIEKVFLTTNLIRKK